MRFYSLLILTSILLTSCQKYTTKENLIFNEGQVIVTGKIENPTDKTIILLALEITGRVKHVAKVDSTGEFRFEFETLSSHDNYLSYAGDLVTIFLEPNDSLGIIADGNNFEKSIKYSGNQTKINQCLQLFSLEFVNALTADKFFEKKRDLSPNEFKAFSSSFFDRMDIQVDSITNLIKPNSEKPKEWLKTFLKYRQAEDLLEYGKHHQDLLDSTYYDFIPDYLEPDKYALECSQYYDDFIGKYYFGYKIRQIDGFKEMASKFKDRTYEGLEGMIDFINMNESNKFAKQIMLTNAINGIVERDFLLADSIFSKYSQVVTDITCQNFILKRIEDKKNKPQIVESLVDLENLDYVGEVFKEIHQNSNNKVLYIDLWGTWCGGCINSFPHINKLNDELEDEKLEFVFLCVKSSKSNWEKIIKEYKLKGTHYLLTKDQYSILSEKFNSYGVPRYILIDKKGNIVDANARPPYSNALKEELKILMDI